MAAETSRGAPARKGFKEPPHSVEAEQSVLGGLLLNNGALSELEQLPLLADDFYRSEHQVIYRAIQEIIKGGKACDFLTIAEYLRDRGLLEPAGGSSYIGLLASETYSLQNVVRYGEVVVERSRLRRFIALGRALTAMGFNPEGRSSEELLELAEERLGALALEVLGEAAAANVDELRPTLPDLLKHYVLIYGTETIWDERKGHIIGMAPLRAAAARDRVKKWLGHPVRRTVHARDLVFEPGNDARAGTINMYKGLPLKPATAPCEKLVELLEHLCSTEDGRGDEKPLTDWVLDWLAFPLQHPGAKMQTALLFHGFPGAGKNLLFKALRQIYGEYCTEIGQAQLEFFRFNGWGSRKLLVIGNEVISRSELKHAEGQLRQWISEATWQVDEKNLPLREEANHANFIFLSNFTVPLSLGRKDRRMCVLYTPREEKPAEFYAAVAAELDAGGAAGLFQQLLARDLGAFNEHTKPPMTQAKSDLMEASAESFDRFEVAWKAGDLPVPFAPCATLDAYRAYRKFCDERGERSPAREAVFLSSLRKCVPTVRKKYRVWDASIERITEGVVYLPSDWLPPSGKTEQDALGLHIHEFRSRLRDWAYDNEAKAGEGSGEGSIP
jgi:Replicative DNA helicase